MQMHPIFKGQGKSLHQGGREHCHLCVPRLSKGDQRKDLTTEDTRDTEGVVVLAHPVLMPAS
jgi:hypothetical protein